MTSRNRVAMTVALCVTAIGCRPSVGPVHHRLAIDTLTFSPDTLVVRIGDTVTWTNHDLVPHTVTALTRPWDSGHLTAGEEFMLVVDVSTPDRYECRYHPSMHAVLRRR